MAWTPHSNSSMHLKSPTPQLMTLQMGNSTRTPTPNNVNIIECVWGFVYVKTRRRRGKKCSEKLCRGFVRSPHTDMMQMMISRCLGNLIYHQTTTTTEQSYMFPQRPTQLASPDSPAILNNIHVIHVAIFQSTHPLGCPDDGPVALQIPISLKQAQVPPRTSSSHSSTQPIEFNLFN